VLRPELAASKAKRFKNELLFCLNTNHKHIVRVVDHGISLDGSTPFYVMPRYSGSLRDLMRSVSDPESRLRYFGQLLSGVEAAHLSGVTHRDLKPENVLYDRSGDTLVLADFGVADFGEDILYTLVETGQNDRLANFLYSAPEQRMRGQVVSPAADLYALGLILHEWFTKEVPQGTGYARIAALDPARGWLDPLIENMLRHNPADRPPDVAAVRHGLNVNRIEFIEHQRLDQLSKQVVEATLPSDPFLETSLAVVGADYKNQELRLDLNLPVNERMKTAFQSPYSRASLPKKGPEAFRLNGKTALLNGVSAEEANRAIEYFKSWIPQVMAVYRQMVEHESREARAQQQRELEREKRELEERATFRRNLRI
jgi:serine/threonine protein kinase